MKKGFLDKLFFPVKKGSKPAGQGDKETLSFDNFERTGSVKVTTNMNQQLAQVVDPARIKQLVEFVREYSDGWSIPDYGVPVATLRLNFHDKDDKILGNFGINPTFVTAMAQGTFWTRPSTPPDRERLLSLLGLDPQKLKI